MHVLLFCLMEMFFLKRHKTKTFFLIMLVMKRWL